MTESIDAPVAIVPAGEAHAPACRLLLPAAFPARGRAPELLVATGAEGIRGALALAWVPGGFSVLLQVLPAWRRSGIGRALMAQGVALARGETPALRAWMPVSADSPADAFLRACGFRVTRRLLVFDTDGDRYSAVLSTLLRRARKRIPAGMALRPLAGMPLPPVAGIVAGEFGVPHHDVIARLDDNHPDAYDRQLSQVLVRDGTLAGAILGRRYGDVIEVDVNVVAPDLRRGVANLMLLEALGRLSKEAGIRRFRFSCEAHVRDTLHLGERSDAARLPDQLLYSLPL
jgi:GNAT superfamily N-acetyltransferase